VRKGKVTVCIMCNKNEIVILSTIEEQGMADYRKLLESLKRHAPAARQLRLVAITGNLANASRKFINENTDIAVPFHELTSSKLFAQYAETLGHPLGKFAKLFYALDYIEAHVADDAVVFFLDPDTLVQSPLDEIAELAETPVLFFGHELQHVHFSHNPNPRLKLAEEFDSSHGWKGSYFAEINTGVIFGKAHVFKRVMSDFLAFVLHSPYIQEVAAKISENHWHDQDFFRYFIRKTLREDIAVLDLNFIYTTTQAAAACIHYDDTYNVFCTNWGEVPAILHFAGGTRKFAEAPNVLWDTPNRKYSIISPKAPHYLGKRPKIKPPLYLRILSKSPLDWVRVFKYHLLRIVPKKKKV